MNFLNLQQSHDWACKNGLNPGWKNSADKLVEGHYWQIHVDLELGSFTPIVLARQIVDWLPNCDCLLWVAEWSVWPSGEDMHLFNRLRASYGETGKLKQTPGQLFASSERDDVTTFLSLSLSFGWDFLLICSGNEDFPIIFGSHDEYMLIAGKTIPDSMHQHFDKNGAIEIGAVI